MHGVGVGVDAGLVAGVGVGLVVGVGASFTSDFDAGVGVTAGVGVAAGFGVVEGIGTSVAVGFEATGWAGVDIEGWERIRNPSRRRAQSGSRITAGVVVVLLISGT